MIKIAFDVGGVLSKYPDILIPLLHELYTNENIEIHIISDMHPVEKIRDMLALNNVSYHFVHSADYGKHGEFCKSEICKEHNIDIIIDDFIGYLAPNYAPIRLLVMPDATLDYYSPEWETDGSEGNFGRRKKS
jgi:hypothetical protein